MTRLRCWLFDPDGQRDERSNSFVLFVLWLPVILGVFGLGIDTARTVYVRSAIQNAVDSAVVGGAAAGVAAERLAGERLTLDRAAALQMTERLYALNRADNPGLMCIGSGARIEGTDRGRCWKTSKPAVITNTTVEYSVQERTKNTFLPVVGIKFQDYNVTGHADIDRPRPLP